MNKIWGGKEITEHNLSPLDSNRNTLSFLLKIQIPNDMKIQQNFVSE